MEILFRSQGAADPGTDMLLDQRQAACGPVGAISIGLGPWVICAAAWRRPPEATPSETDFLRLVTRIESARNRVAQLRLTANVTRDSVAYHCYLTESTATNGYCPDPRD